MSLFREKLYIRNNINNDKIEIIQVVTNEQLSEYEKDMLSNMKRDDVIRYIKKEKHGTYMDVIK